MGIRSLSVDAAVDQKMKTLDKNFSYGYNDGLYNLREEYNDEFCCYYQKASYIPISFKEECINVATDISDYARSKNTIPVILLSGGLDSEVVVRSFMESGREFEIITSRFSNDLNRHELEYVKNFCEKNNLSINYFDINIEEWLLGDEAMSMADDSKCVNPEMLPTMKLIKEISKNGKVPVLGNGDLYLSKEINPEWRMGRSQQKYQWMYIEYEYILAWMRYCVKHGITGGINFYQQTPEIVLSMALDPLIQDLVENNTIGKQSSRSTKYLVYKRYWPDIEIRPKFHGGEKIYSLCDYLKKKSLNRKYRFYTSKWMMLFDDFIKMLMPT